MKVIIDYDKSQSRYQRYTVKFTYGWYDPFWRTIERFETRLEAEEFALEVKEGYPWEV